MSNRIDPTDSSRPTVVKTGQFYWRQHRLAYERYGDAGAPCPLVHGILLAISASQTSSIRVRQPPIQHVSISGHAC